MIHQKLREEKQSGRPVLWVETSEDERLFHLLQLLGRESGSNLGIWQSSPFLPSAQQCFGFEAGTPLKEVLPRLLSQEPWAIGPMIYWLKDVTNEEATSCERLLKDLYLHGVGQQVLFVISSQEAAPTIGLKKRFPSLLLPPPDREELSFLLNDVLARKTTPLMMQPEVAVALLQGLSWEEARHALMFLLDESRDEAAQAELLRREKRKLLAREGALSFVDEVPKLAHIGGLERLKSWLKERHQLFFQQGTSELVPKGILLMGISGCGKSLCVKAISSAWQLPLYRLEMINVFSGGLGSPEKVFAESLAKAEALAPAILWIDEIEMGLSAEGSKAVDPVMSRIFAHFLTWMQEKPHGLFVAATANRIDLLPAEMIRKGRFDQVFFVDLPGKQEREAIFRVHLNQRGLDPETFTPEVFADSSEQWNGAEIEQLVVSALTRAKMEGRTLELRDLYTARKQIVPLAKTMEDQVRHIRNWAFERAVRASEEA